MSKCDSDIRWVMFAIFMFNGILKYHSKCTHYSYEFAEAMWELYEYDVCYDIVMIYD